MYAVIEIDTKGNYRETIEKANVLVTAFGTDLNYIENQAAKGTELKIKKEPDSRGIDPSNRRYDIDESNSETGDVPSPKTNIPQNGNAVNTIVYEKAVDGSFYVVEAVPDSKAKKLRLITAYISKKTPSAQVAHANKSRESTPETSLHTDGVQGDVPSPKTNIPQNGNAVNIKKQSNFEKAVQKKAPGVLRREPSYNY